MPTPWSSSRRPCSWIPATSTAACYLATAYMSQYIPGADSPDNMQLAKQAKEEFIKVLENHPNDTTALASLASLSYQQAKTCRI